MGTTVSWDVLPHSLLGIHQRVAEICCLCLQGRTVSPPSR